MKRVNQHTFYQLGATVHPLTLIDQDANLNGVAWELNKARAWLEFLFSNQSYGLIVCRDKAQEVIAAIDAVVPKNTGDIPKIDPQRQLTWWEAYRIRNSVAEFEVVFAAELPTMDTYIVSKKGIYSTADLVERADMAFDDEAREHLSAEVLSDFKQAGRCLAFELATAAGFHTMRAVEAVLRNYWRLVKNPPVDKKAPEMAVCINELRAAKESEKLMDILDHARDLHRNTIMHPDVFLDLKDALRLFDVGKSAISAMADRIGELEAAAEQEAQELAQLEAAEREEKEAEAGKAMQLEAPKGENAAPQPPEPTILMLDDQVGGAGGPA